MIFLSCCVRKTKRLVQYVYSVNQALPLLLMVSYVSKCVFPCGCDACVCVGIVSEELEELQRLHSCKEAEQEGVVLRLQEQLRSTCEELDKVRSTLRTLEGADGCGEICLNIQTHVQHRTLCN